MKLLIGILIHGSLLLISTIYFVIGFIFGVIEEMLDSIRNGIE